MHGQGKLYGLQDKPVQAAFSTGAKGLELEAGGERLLLEWQGLGVARGGFQDRLWVVLAEHEGRSLRLYVSEPEDFGSRLLALPLPQGLAERVRSAERGHASGRRAARIALLAGLLLLGAGFWFGPSILVRLVAAQVPESWEKGLGRAAASELLAEHRGACTARPFLDPVEEIAGRLVQAAGRRREEFRVFVLDSPEVNAFALPGGYLFVCRGLLAEARSADEAAGVLAHEVQHALLRHGIRNVLYQAGIGLLLRMLLGDEGGLGDLAARSAAGLSGLAFSRGQETEADHHGLELAAAAGFDPHALGRFFRRIAESAPSVPTLLSTHPSSEDRAERLERRIAELPAPVLRPLQSPWPVPEAPCERALVPDPDKPPAGVR
jgi:Zn-dependent protease with chaperone function